MQKAVILSAAGALWVRVCAADSDHFFRSRLPFEKSLENLSSSRRR